MIRTFLPDDFAEILRQRIFDENPLRDLIGRKMTVHLARPFQGLPYIVFSPTTTTKMKISIDKSYTQAQLEIALATATAAGANCAKVLPKGRSRASVLGLEKLTTYLGHEVSVEFGKRKALGLPFESLDDATTEAESEGQPAGDVTVTIVPSRVELDPEVTKPAKSRKAKPAKATSPRGDFKHKEKKPKGVAPRTNTGFVAFIDKLLHAGVSKELIEGYHRSKHTVASAVNAVMAQFPDKDPVSVKKIVKVRPRSLTVRATAGVVVPRWAYVGPGHSDGVMKRVKQMIAEGTHTARQITDVVSAEFGKNPATFVRTVEAQINREEKKAKKPLTVKVKPKVPPSVKKAKVAATKNKNKEKRAAELERLKKKRRASNAEA